jgi:trk system potassium uptake protein TrkA
MLDFIEFDDGFVLSKMYPPKPIRGMTLAESDIRSKYRVTVVGVKSPGEEFTYAEPATRISDHDVIIVAGVPEDVERFSSLQS